jgi:DNA-binding NarL/FixJ family response regulator
MVHANESLSHPARRFLLIDDHPIVCDALRYTLESVSPGALVDYAASFAEARRLLAESRPYDCMLLDLGLPDSDGYEALTRLREQRPGVPIVILSAEAERDTILHCLELGAHGFIPKSAHHDVIRHALRLVAAGHMYVPREAIRGEWGVANRATPRVAQRDPRSLGLTSRQCDVLRLILKGLPNKLICRELDLAEGTVKIHVSAVLRALGARNRTQAVVAANQLGLRLATE